MTIDDPHIQSSRRSFLMGVGAGSPGEIGFRPVLAQRSKRRQALLADTAAPLASS
jgi:hypothetical protein